MVQVCIKLEDEFSGAVETLNKEVGSDVFEKMCNSIGSTFTRYNPAQGIRFDWKVVSVEQINKN
jgi:hypothetical protein